MVIFLVLEVSQEGSLVWLKDQVSRPIVVSDDEALVRYPLGIPSMVFSLVIEHLSMAKKERVTQKEMIAPMMKVREVVAWMRV